MKLVKEHISFKKHTDHKESLGVGRIPEIKEWLDKYKIIHYIINDDFTINCNRSVFLDYKHLTSVPNYIKFNRIDGGFFCDNNELISLEFCPTIVIGNFFCSYNKLTSLEGCPKIVSERFYCTDNSIKFTEEDVLSRCRVKRELIKV